MPDKELFSLEREHQNWHIRHPANAGYFIATRRDRTHLTDDELHAGLCMTLIEDSPDLLQEALTLQAKIEATL